MMTLALTFLKIGFMGFGGGYAMLALIYQDSLKLGLSTAAFADLNALDLIAPGPIAVNSATYVGYLTYGIVGAILATLAVSTSSVVLTAVLIRYEDSFFQHPLIGTFLSYTKLAAVGMTASVAISLIVDALAVEELPLISISSMLLTLFLRFKLKRGIFSTMFCVGVLGAVFYLLRTVGWS